MLVSPKAFSTWCTDWLMRHTMVGKVIIIIILIILIWDQLLGKVIIIILCNHIHVRSAAYKDYHPQHHPIDHIDVIRLLWKLILIIEVKFFFASDQWSSMMNKTRKCSKRPSLNSLNTLLKRCSIDCWRSSRLWNASRNVKPCFSFIDLVAQNNSTIYIWNYIMLRYAVLH